MKAKAKYLSVAAAALFIGMSASFAGPSTGAYTPLQTAKQAKALPTKAKVMMACAGCRTIRPLNKKGIAAWFSTKVKHDCPACGGKLTTQGEFRESRVDPRLSMCTPARTAATCRPMCAPVTKNRN